MPEINPITHGNHWKHGLSSSPIYRVWRTMLERCSNPKTKGYERYGGRGITVCEEWHSFETFLRDLGQRPTPKHSIERINNNGNYEPSNCRWATIQEQARNRRSNVWVTIGSRTMIATDWAIEYGLNPSTVREKLRTGQTVEEALGLKQHRRIDMSRRRRDSLNSPVSYKTIDSRMRRGWSFEEASTVPPQKGQKPLSKKVRSHL